MKTLFQYAVLLHIYDKNGSYEDSKIIVDVTSALAKSQKDLIFKITRAIPEEYASEPDHVQIIITSFSNSPVSSWSMINTTGINYPGYRSGTPYHELVGSTSTTANNNNIKYLSLTEALAL